jgi:hypothetical protein
VDEKREASTPRAFLFGSVIAVTAGAAAYRTSRTTCYIAFMVLNRTSMMCRRIVIDDHARLPGRFFGRFATSATSELTRTL